MADDVDVVVEECEVEEVADDVDVMVEEQSGKEEAAQPGDAVEVADGEMVVVERQCVKEAAVELEMEKVGDFGLKVMGKRRMREQRQPFCWV